MRNLRKIPKRRPSSRPEVEYFAALARLVGKLSAAVRRVVLPRLPAIVRELARTDDSRADAAEILDKTIGDLRLAWAASAPLSEIRKTAKKAGRKVSEADKRDQDRIVKTVLKIDLELAEPWLTPKIDQFAKDNAALVRKVGEGFADSLQDKIAEGVRKGKRAEELEAEIVRDFVGEGEEIQKAKRRAKLIARDQAAKLRADITKTRQQAIGVKRYRWRTVGDQRVRGEGESKRWPGSHAARENEIFEWGKPIRPQLRKKGLVPAKIDGHPGEPINCRCYAEPVLSDVVEGLPEI